MILDFELRIPFLLTLSLKRGIMESPKLDSITFSMGFPGSRTSSTVSSIIPAPLLSSLIEARKGWVQNWLRLWVAFAVCGLDFTLAAQTHCACTGEYWFPIETDKSELGRQLKFPGLLIYLGPIPSNYSAPSSEVEVSPEHFHVWPQAKNQIKRCVTFIFRAVLLNQPLVIVFFFPFNF